MTRPRIAALICSLAALLLLAWQWRQRAIVAAPMTAIVFDHQDHSAVSCKTCHHNFFDETGRDSCYFCHKQRPELALTIQRDFHHLCRDCHARVANAGYDSGPLRRCDGCHDWTVTQKVVPVAP
ncbi:MAG TPA: cytochrome c3 family protein [Gammaproteobacteria bacterium]|nr:cytochrome c3 family protein [Gammaproteobacteria bacterium]